MKNSTSLRLKRIIEKLTKISSTDFSGPDIGADKTKPDNDSDNTIKKIAPGKSKLEINPDSTGIDTKADKMNKPKAKTFPKKEQ